MKNLLLLYGGQSPEHEISRISGGAILRSLDFSQYNIHLIAIALDGSWFYHEVPAASEIDVLFATDDPKKLIVPTDNEWPVVNLTGNKTLSFKNEQPELPIDFIFPILHGPNGEDGRLQGYLEMLGIPFAGCGMYASALCMDKAWFKDVLTQHRFPQTPYIWLEVFAEPNKEDTLTLAKGLGPWFEDGEKKTVYVKPSRMGSSIGISRVENIDDTESFKEALNEAKRYDHKVIIEKAVAEMIEVEFAVLGNENPEAAGPGEIEAGDEFYSFDAKYIADDGAELRTKSTLDTEAVTLCRNLAIKAYRICECRGFARVDGFYTKSGDYLINEINTLPGFTSISMYPKLWESENKPVKDLLNEIINFGLEEHRRKAKHAHSI